MNYFVTGATGFIGRHLLAELLKREGTIYVLVREGSRGKIDALVQRLGAEEGRIAPVTGDLSKPGLGIEGFGEPIDHFFHLAAIYDMAADEDGHGEGQHRGHPARDRVRQLDRGRPLPPHQLDRRGRRATRASSRRTCSTRGRRLPHAYHRTKYESERLVREGVQAKTLVFRPGIVVGHSETGEMDKIDGPYYYFKLLQRLRHALPEWAPLAGPQGGETNIVPVDFVAKAMDHIAHLPDAELPQRHLPPGQPRADEGRRDAQRVRQGRPRAAVRDARSTRT